MTNDDAYQEYLKIIEENIIEEEEIMRKAKKEGKLKMGLDSNSELFKESKDRAWAKIEKLIELVDK